MKKKYKPSASEIIEMKARERGLHYADIQKEEIEQKRKWWIKGAQDGKKIL